MILLVTGSLSSGTRQYRQGRSTPTTEGTPSVQSPVCPYTRLITVVGHKQGVTKQYVRNDYTELKSENPQSLLFTRKFLITGDRLSYSFRYLML